MGKSLKTKPCKHGYFPGCKTVSGGCECDDESFIKLAKKVFKKKGDFVKLTKRVNKK